MKAVSPEYPAAKAATHYAAALVGGLGAAGPAAAGIHSAGRGPFSAHQGPAWVAAGLGQGAAPALARPPAAAVAGATAQGAGPAAAAARPGAGRGSLGLPAWTGSPALFGRGGPGLAAPAAGAAAADQVMPAANTVRPVLPPPRPAAGAGGGGHGGPGGVSTRTPSAALVAQAATAAGPAAPMPAAGCATPRSSSGATRPRPSPPDGAQSRSPPGKRGRLGEATPTGGSTRVALDFTTPGPVAAPPAPDRGGWARQEPIALAFDPVTSAAGSGPEGRAVEPQRVPALSLVVAYMASCMTGLETVYATADTPEMADAGYKRSLELLHVVYGYLLQLEYASAADAAAGAPPRHSARVVSPRARLPVLSLVMLLSSRSWIATLAGMVPEANQGALPAARAALAVPTPRPPGAVGPGGSETSANPSIRLNFDQSSSAVDAIQGSPPATGDTPSQPPHPHLPLSLLQFRRLPESSAAPDYRLGRPPS